MKQRIQGLIIGLLIGALCLGGTAIAKKAVATLEVDYCDIKVYKDNVPCTLTDANGTTVEPFIYNGTTYLPVRGTANLADMQVTWDGATKSVYLWDEIIPEDTFFLDVCYPYSTNKYCIVDRASEGDWFTMSGEKYSNGLIFRNDGSALFNLNGKYQSIECTVGHYNTGYLEYSKSITFVVDGKEVKTVSLGAESLPVKVTVPLNYGLQLKIIAWDNAHTDSYTVGVGNMIVH